MSAVKLIALVVVLLVAAIAGYVFIDQNLNGHQPSDSSANVAVTTTTAAGIEWYQDGFKALQVAVFSERDLSFDFYSQNAPALQEQAQLNNYVLALNGSYYLGSYINAEHAGLLQVKGNVVKGLGYDRQQQATHVVVYNHQTKAVKFVDTREIKLEDYKSQDFSLMQTGPLLINQGQVQTELIKNSLNGSGRYTRVVLGTTKSGKTFVALTRVAMTLSDLAQRLIDLDVFRDEDISVINLDGGSSTAMYTAVVESFNFGHTKRLPIVIGIK